MTGYRRIGTGSNVFESDAVVEAPVRWLDSPQDVIAFMGSGAVRERIVIARGGTTTFLAPVLSGGVRGVISLQGAPESHLGILAREFGIPCVMSVAFSEGIETARGETIPADDTVVRLDVGGYPDGHVLVSEGAR